MPEINYHSAVTGRDPEILELLGNCFPDYWRAHADKGVFPHKEVAFLADSGGRAVGHVGVMPFEAFTRNGRTVRLGGIASVATDPAYRGRGIAATLCRMALDWGKSNGIAAMPLFTSVFSVYEKSGWQVYDVPDATGRLAARNPAAHPAAVKEAADLTEQEKIMIMGYYEKQPPFPGKVLRTADGDFHSWGRIFRRKDCIFYLADSGYGLQIDGVLAEFCFAPGQEDELLRRIVTSHGGPMICAVPDLKVNPREFTMAPSPVDPCHGEKPMWNWTQPASPDSTLSRLIDEREFHFPLADKF